jgi:hypothetical protein
MNASTRTETVWEMAPVQERSGGRSVAPWPQEVCSGEQSGHRGPIRPHVFDEAGSETFIDGAGI